jgi:hypothetical protein
VTLISDLLVEYVERDEKEGRVLVRPAVGRNLPFGDGFEKLLLAWSFLNVMGYVQSVSFYFKFPSRISSRIQLRQVTQKI